MYSKSSSEKVSKMSTLLLKGRVIALYLFLNNGDLKWQF